MSLPYLDTTALKTLSELAERLEILSADLDQLGIACEGFAAGITGLELHAATEDGVWVLRMEETWCEAEYRPKAMQP